MTTQSLVICSSPAHLAIAREIALLLLSPDATPSGLPRQQWEPLLVEQPRKLGTALPSLIAGVFWA